VFAAPNHWTSISTMYISVVILSYNSAKSLTRCLDDLRGCLTQIGRPFEVFIVDNGSRDASRDIIREQERRYDGALKPIYFEQNTGTTYSRNAALRKATGQYLLVLDSDAYVNAGALRLLIEYLDANPATGIAVPRLYYGSGRFQLSTDRFPTLVHKFKRFLFLRKMERNRNPTADATAPIDVDYAISACWLIRRDAFEATGLLDEKIFYSPEDVDYCLRVWAAGYRITYVPAAELVHDAQELSRGFRLSRFHFSHLKGVFYLQHKHRYYFGLRRLYRRLDRFAR
jgi:GT2 family glycosyltransferase